jgi:hypothetical protein
MKKATQFVAEDGTVFENQKDCKIYELSKIRFSRQKKTLIHS